MTLSGLKQADFESEMAGKKTAMYVLKNSKGAEICVTNYGGAVMSIMMPDKNGEYANINLIALIPLAVDFFIAAGTLTSFFNSFVSCSILSKVISSILCKDGEMLPLFKKETYVPMIQNENRGSI